MSDLKTDASEDQLSQAGTAPGEAAPKLRERVLAGLQGARKKATHVQIVVVTNGKKAVRATDNCVHEHPWASIGIAAGVGVLVGLLINRD
jgi:ElaB/YqjD/DUF883 family membrane-anchored ribosome-binding protein